MAPAPGHSSLTDEPDRFRYAPVLAENVRRLRMRARINKKRFALMVGIGRPFLDKIERGEANARLDIIVRMADALETTPEYLLRKHGPQDDLAPGGQPESKAANQQDGSKPGLPEAPHSSAVRHSRLF